MVVTFTIESFLNTYNCYKGFGECGEVGYRVYIF